MPSDRSNLENLARAKQLNAERADRGEIDHFLARAEAQLRDARAPTLSPESRFALAYNAAHSLALAALRAAGYRPSSAGHRRIAFQTLDVTAGAAAELWVALDRYHDRRNRMEYEGVPVSAVEAEDLLKLSTELRALVRKRLGFAK